MGNAYERKRALPVKRLGRKERKKGERGRPSLPGWTSGNRPFRWNRCCSSPCPFRRCRRSSPSPRCRRCQYPCRWTRRRRCRGRSPRCPRIRSCQCPSLRRVSPPRTGLAYRKRQSLLAPCVHAPANAHFRCCCRKRPRFLTAPNGSRSLPNRLRNPIHPCPRSPSYCRRPVRDRSSACPRRLRWNPFAPAKAWAVQSAKRDRCILIFFSSSSPLSNV